MRWLWLGLGALVLAVLGFRYERPIPPPQAIPRSLPLPEVALSALPWPPSTEAAVAIPALHWEVAYGPSRPIPIGSLTKMMTTYLLLQRHPLAVGEQGPALVANAADAQVWRQDLATQQSVAPVFPGMRITELEMVQALMVASANNIAAMVARWLAGSPGAFAQVMNQTAGQLGLRHTHYVGPSGLNPGNVSTPQDQIRLAEVAMQNPVFAQAASLSSMAWPAAPHTLFNYNFIVGQDGIDGVKTGSTTVAGASFVFSAPRRLNGLTLTVYGAILGQHPQGSRSQLQLVLSEGRSLLDAVSADLRPRLVLRAGDQVGELKYPWGATVPLLAAQDLRLPTLPGLHWTETLSWQSPQGTLTVSSGSLSAVIPVRAAGSPPPPPIWWRIRR
ncbi:MAG: hypothetical protein K6U87_08450 [Firmicutes bacterium]|nr:hypothetical protein [Bacillota bacterium]